VLTDSDLVDLAASGSDVTRSLIAHRPALSRAVCAALVEVGSIFDVLTTLGNDGARITRRSLKRVCERFGDDVEVRALLLDRTDLPSAARHALVEKVGTALAGDGLVRAAVGARRVEQVTREACAIATIGLAADVEGDEIGDLVEHLRVNGRLTPVFLMQALCAGRIEFFAAAIVNLSGEGERRVRSILADGREAAVRALFEAAGLGGDISALFADAVLLWRKEAKCGADRSTVAARLAARNRQAGEGASRTLIETVEGLAIAEQRRFARSYALMATRDAA
jgi:uncharacterized protein (DUF2336 family)